MRLTRRPAGLSLMAAERHAVAAMEFAMIAPILAIMLLAVFDGARALVSWQQTQNAAQAVAEAAEKLSVAPGTTATALTFTQMQTAMTTIFAEMPGLGGAAQAAGTEQYGTSSYSVTLSEIVYCPMGNANTITQCGGTAPQQPYTYWSTYLQGIAAPGLIGTITKTDPLMRACGKLTPEYPTWTGNSIAQRLTQMVDPSHQGANAITLTPQIVADISYNFTPSFSQMFLAGASVTFTASAMLPTPFGDNTQPIAYTVGAGDGTILNCQNQLP